MTDEQGRFDDIANAVLRLRAAFLRHNLTPPTIIELANHSDGDKLRISLPKEMIAPTIERDPDNGTQANVAIEICGVKFIYPAMRRQITSKRAEWL